MDKQHSRIILFPQVLNKLISLSLWRAELNNIGLQLCFTCKVYKYIISVFYIAGILNKTNIPLALDGYEMIKANNCCQVPDIFYFVSQFVLFVSFDSANDNR